MQRKASWRIKNISGAKKDSGRDCAHISCQIGQPDPGANGHPRTGTSGAAKAVSSTSDPIESHTLEGCDTAVMKGTRKPPATWTWSQLGVFCRGRALCGGANTSDGKWSSQPSVGRLLIEFNLYHTVRWESVTATLQYLLEANTDTFEGMFSGMWVENFPELKKSSYSGNTTNPKQYKKY